jgi:hypothetical protein
MPSTVEDMGVVIDEAWSMGHVLPCCDVEAHGDTVGALQCRPRAHLRIVAVRLAGTTHLWCSVGADRAVRAVMEGPAVPA